MNNTQYIQRKDFSTKSGLSQDLISKYQILFYEMYESPADDIIVFRAHNEKWGALKMDHLTHKDILIAESIYEWTSFNPKMALITALQYIHGEFSMKGNSYTFMDSDGKIVKKLNEYYSVQFNEFRKLIVSKETAVGLLDEKFTELIPCKYLSLIEIKENIFVAADNIYAENRIINEKDEVLYRTSISNEIFPAIYKEKVIVREDKVYFLFDVNSKEKIKLPYDKIIPISVVYYSTIGMPFQYVTMISLDKAPAQAFFEKGKYGIIFGDGEVSVPNIYDQMWQIQNDHFKVALGDFHVERYQKSEELEEISVTGIKWGIINSNNETIIPIDYTDIYFKPFPKGYTAYQGGIMSGEKEFMEKVYWFVKDGKAIEFPFKE